MPIVIDNSFSRDSYGMRAERLIAIQSNFVSIQSKFNAPTHSSNSSIKINCSNAHNSQD